VEGGGGDKMIKTLIRMIVNRNVYGTIRDIMNKIYKATGLR
jgi:hypothetical protein